LPAAREYYTLRTQPSGATVSSAGGWLPRHGQRERLRRYADALRYGQDMTVAIAAFPPSKTEIVTVSDQRLSYGEIIPAADEGTMKNIKITRKWSIMFAAEDATAFTPVSNETMKSLLDLKLPSSKFAGLQRDYTMPMIMDAARRAYEKEFNERFFREKLARFGFADISEFRKFGYAEMGKDLYHQYSMDLAKFDLGLELLVYGFDELGQRAIFEVANPGKIIDHTMRGYAAIGSGTLMALAALNKKPLGPTLADTIYRVVDAKFSSETARDVGKKTHVITLNSEGKNGFLYDAQLEKLHHIWEAELARPHPKDAIDFINQCDVVTDLLKATTDSQQKSPVETRPQK
jgi:hypothetical protein